MKFLHCLLVFSIFSFYSPKAETNFSFLLAPRSFPQLAGPRSSLISLFRLAADPHTTPAMRAHAQDRLKEIYSALSSTGIDSDISALDQDESGESKLHLPDLFLCYSFLDLLLKTQQYLHKNFSPAERSVDTICRRIDRQLEQVEEALARDSKLGDPFTTRGLRKIAAAAMKLSGVSDGYFVKKEVICRMLRIYPPVQLLAHYRCQTVDELLQAKDALEIFSLARYTESKEWLDACLRYWGGIEADDFEKRPVTVVIYGEEIPPRAKDYFANKLPFSNDKVAGTLTGFAVPPDPKNRVPRLRALTRALHYLHEIHFYSSVVGIRLPGCREENLPIGDLFQNVLEGQVNITQFFDTHALAETLFWTQGVRDLLHVREIPIPEEWNQIPFAFALDTDSTFKLTSLVDRITALARGKPSDLHARRYLRLAPLLHYWRSPEAVGIILASFYLNGEWLESLIKMGVSPLHLTRIDPNEALQDYSPKVEHYATFTDFHEEDSLSGHPLTQPEDITEISL